MVNVLWIISFVIGWMSHDVIKSFVNLAPGTQISSWITWPRYWCLHLLTVSSSCSCCRTSSGTNTLVRCVIVQLAVNIRQYDVISRSCIHLKVHCLECMQLSTNVDSSLCFTLTFKTLPCCYIVICMLDYGGSLSADGQRHVRYSTRPTRQHDQVC